MPVSQTADLPASPPAAGDDPLASALRDPEVRASLAVIAAHAPDIAVLVASSQALLARGRDIADNINDRVEVLRASGSGRADLNMASYLDLLRAVGDASPTIQTFLTSSVLRPEIVDVISRVGEAALEADRLTRQRKVSVGGALALLRQLKDPQIQETLGFFLAFARAFGREQEHPAGNTRPAGPAGS